MTRADGTLTASWDAPAGAATYHVTYSADGKASWGLAALDHPASGGASESITFDVDNAKTYIVGVRAKNEHGGSGWRNSAAAGPYTPPPPPPPPATVASVTITRDDGALTASWDAPSGATSYHVTYTDNGGSSWQLAAFDHAETSIVINADNDKTYIVGVRARNEQGGSGWRNSAAAGPYTPPPPTSPPARPTGLTATADDESVSLAWDDPADAAITGYEYRARWAGVAWGAWTAIAGSDADTTSHTISGLTNGTEYRFKLRAVNAAGESGAAPTGSPWYVAATPEEMAFGQAQGVSLVASDVTYSTASLMIVGHTGPWYYQQTAPSSGSCSSSHAATEKATLKRLEPGVSYTFKAYSDAACATEVTGDATDAEFTTSTVMLSTPWHIVPEGESVPHTVWLSQQPTATVTVTVATTGDSDITASPATLTFTPSNWSTPQTVTLSAAQDSDTVPGSGKGDGSYAYGATDVTHTATSSDAAFNNVSVVLKATEGDDDVCSGTTAVGGSGVTSGALVEDCDTLLAAKDIVNGSTGVVNNWSTGLALNSWTGITAANDRVTRFNLAFSIHAGGDGNLPNTIADLDALTRLVMESGGAAALPGPIPPGIENLTGLTRLGLYKRELTGRIPANIGNLTALTILELDENQLSGPLPASLAKLTGLTRIWLSNNRLTGAIPTELGSLTSLTTDNVGLDGNQLIGCIPTGWSKYASKINPQKDANGNDVNLPLCPGQVAQPAVAPLFEGAQVDWSAPTVGEATRYQIRWRPCLVSRPVSEECYTYDSPPPTNGPDTRPKVPAWAPWKQVTYLGGLKSGLDTVLGGDTTSYTIGGLRNGVRYQVKVRPGFTLPGRFGKTIYGP